MLRLTIDAVGGRCEWVAVRPNWSGLSDPSSGGCGCMVVTWTLVTCPVNLNKRCTGLWWIRSWSQQRGRLERSERASVENVGVYIGIS